MPELPSGTVSFLFTDIEGSTRMLTLLRERYGEVLADHNRLLRAAFAETGGQEMGTEGDAFFVAFGRAHDAVAAAAAAQRALTAYPWPEGGEVRVRMGIHTGEPSLGDEGYLGLSLHRAARISSAGHGGQVLLSNATRELVEDDLPPGLGLRDLGEQRLKDLDRPERIFQLVIDGLRNDFPALKTLPQAGRKATQARSALRRRGVLAAMLAIAAAAVAIPVFALGRGGSGGGSSSPVAPDSVGVIDPRTNAVVGQIAVGARPSALAAAAGALWVANLDDRSVSRIDLASQRAVKAIAIGETPDDLATGAGAVWVVSGGPHRDFALVRKIDASFNAVVRTVTVRGSGFGGGSGAVAAGKLAVWAVTGGPSRVSRIDPGDNRVVATLDAGPSPTSIAVGGGALWVADAFASTVTRIDPETGVVAQTIPVGHGPAAIAVGAGAVWVADALDDAIVRIDPGTNAVTATIPVGRFPVGVAVGAGAVWVANSRDGTLSRVDPIERRVAKTIEVGGSPQDVAVAADRVWVSVQAPELAEQAGGTARLTAQADIDSLDPALASAGLSWQLEYATCAKLLNYPDRPAPLGAQLEPEVAKTLPTVSADGRTYTFTIRKGFRFSPPSNEPVTARTFKYAIERTLSPRMLRGAPADVRRPRLDDVVGAKAYAAGKASGIVGVVARGNRLTIRLVAPAPDFPARIAQPFFCAVPTNTPIEPGGVRTVPAAGPYYVASYTPGQRVALKRNPNYSGGRPHRLEEIDLAFGVSQQESVARVESGDADYVVDGVPPDAAARLASRFGPRSPAARSRRQQYFVNPKLELDFLVLNGRRPLFADARLRRAVSYAIDRRVLARADVTPAVPADHYLPPNMPGVGQGRLYPFGPDLAKARRLVGGRRGTAVYYTCDLLPCTRVAQSVKESLNAIGIDVRVEEFPLGTFLDKLGTPGEPFDIAFFGHNADDSDPGNYLEGLPLLLRDPVYARKLRAAASLSGAKRYLAYGALDVDLARNAVPLAVFAAEVSQDFFSARMGCQAYNPLYGMDLAALCIRR